MSIKSPVAPNLRMLVFGQVIGAWIIVTILAGWFLSGMLGHVSLVGLIPLAWQTLAGGLLHGTLALLGSRNALVSLPLSLAIGLVSTTLTIVGIAVYSNVSIPALLANVGRVYVLLFVFAEASALLGWFFARRTLNDAPSA
jgi:hypothetical protein